MSRKTLIAGLLAAGGMAATLATGANAAQPTVVELTQTACQFVESENGVDHGYTSTGKADCQAINGKSGDERLANAKVMELDAGSYIFRVTNKNVPYDLGFWLRGKGLGRVTLPSVSGGGLSEGATKDYAIDLTPGEYHYSCPLNPTLDYVLVVRG
ncbi:MAG: hypothetical protein MI806_11970 [Minwuiales bacterium]|nr:hypothetical protein [Minwuiales bacterium]